jgi:hypothetical protein
LGGGSISILGTWCTPHTKNPASGEGGAFCRPLALNAGERGGTAGGVAARERPPAGGRGDKRGAFRAGRDGETGR